uniref:Serine/threonine-protein kinase receptor n=1 Tax=Heterorhabditis bacteriophora TaxID=37862 RepID=A0A1I7X573_HETBA
MGGPSWSLLFSWLLISMTSSSAEARVRARLRRTIDPSNELGHINGDTVGSITMDHDYLATTYGKLGVNYDMDNGNPYINCERFNISDCDPSQGECPTSQKCYIDPGNRAQRLGCMTVFKYSVNMDNSSNDAEANIQVTLKGCWQHDKEVIEDCLEDDHRKRTDTHATTENVTSVPQLLHWSHNAWYILLFALLGSAIIAGVQTGEANLLLTKHSTASVLSLEAKPVAYGRFGEVFRGTYRSGGREDQQVAVKVFPLKDEESWLAEQTIYIDVLNRVPHKSILRYMGAERKEKEYWLVTEYWPLGCLYDYLKPNDSIISFYYEIVVYIVNDHRDMLGWHDNYVLEHVITVQQALRLITAMLDGLAFLHEDRRGKAGEEDKYTVVHRDIKSRNILLKNDNANGLTACIADFGLAAKFLKQQIDDQATGQVGTRRYMAPEVLEGATEFTVAAFRQIDVYAISLVMWEVLSRTETNLNDKVEDYRVPFDEFFKHPDTCPTLGEMRDIVVTQKKRPTFRRSLLENPITRQVCQTIEEMWDTMADGRITASCALERMKVLLSGEDSEGYHSAEHEDEPRPKSTMSTGFGPPRCPESSVDSASFNRAMEKYDNERVRHQQSQLIGKR